jgi:hypothetical protein
MRKSLSLCVAVLASLVLSGPAFAQSDPAQTPSQAPSATSQSQTPGAQAAPEATPDPQAGTTDANALPATASPLGLVGLLGLLSLGASAAVRAWRRLS